MANIDRRNFLRASAAGAAFLATAPVAGAKPQAAGSAKDLNGKLRLAAIGTGGKGQDDLQSISASPRVEVVALCDVDSSHDHLGWAAEKFPKAERFSDYRRLLDKAIDVRCGECVDAGSYACANRAGGDGVGEARVLPEATGAFGA